MPLRRTLCFYVLFLAHVSKTLFFACFSRKSTAQAALQAGLGKTKSGQNDRKNTGFWKPVEQNDRKNVGSASVECPNLLFCGVFLRLS